MKNLIFIVACSLILAAVSCKKSSQQPSAPAADTLAMLSDRVNGLSFPLRSGSDATVDSVRLLDADSLMSLYITLDDDLIDSAAIVSDFGMKKFILALLIDNDSLESMLDIASHVPVALSVQVTGSSYAPAVSFLLDRSMVRSLRLEPAGLRQRDELKVRNRVRYDNTSCPFEIEDGVTLISMSVQDRYVTFHSEVDVEKLDFLLMKQNRDSLNVGVVASLREQLADSVQRQSLLDIADARLGYRNRYVASDRSDSFDISFTPADLVKLIAVSDSIASSGDKRKHSK